MNNLEGIHKDYTFWLDAMKFTTDDDFKKYIRRLTALATQVTNLFKIITDKKNSKEKISNNLNNKIAHVFKLQFEGFFSCLRCMSSSD